MTRNLRDYGTAEWEGGNPECDHQPVGNWRDPKKNAAILSSNGHGPKSGKLGRDCVCGAHRIDDQLGLEATPQEFIANMVDVFRDIRRVLRSDGTCWVNMGDSYAGSWGSQGRDGGVDASPLHARQVEASFKRQSNTGSIEIGSGLKPKDLVGMPWRLALALQADGWYLRQDIIWHKPNPMPESVQDRCTKAHEYIFLFSKSEEYFFDAEAIKEKCSTNTHARGGGVNPKAKKAGQHSRMRVDRDPRHMVNGVPRKDLNAPHLPGNKTHKGTTAYLAGDEMQRTKGGLVDYASKMRTRSKQNDYSFSAAVTEIVEMRNKRDVWTMATAPFKEAHFATFPPALPRTCIKAGTSAKGCCSVCGRPFERIVERLESGRKQKAGDGWDQDPGAHGSIHREGRVEGRTDQAVIVTRTIGWEEDCCRLFGGHAVPCTVLDPFSGAGTSGMVAEELGRNYIGLELKLEYAMLTLKRKGMEQTEIVQ